MTTHPVETYDEHLNLQDEGWIPPEKPMPSPSELARMEEANALSGSTVETVGEVHSYGLPTTKDTNPKDAIGSTKPPLSTVPMPVLFEVGAAMLEGACKYARHNYRVAGVRSSVYFDAAMRHLAAWWEGEENDPDSGISHITKVIAGLVVLRDAQMSGMVKFDDRPPKAHGGWMEDMQEKVSDVLEHYPNPLPPYTSLVMHEAGDPTPNADPEFVLSVSLPISDSDGDIYDFEEYMMHKIEVRDEAHGLALANDLAQHQYTGRVVTLWRTDPFDGVREPLKTFRYIAMPESKFQDNDDDDDGEDDLWQGLL